MGSVYTDRSLYARLFARKEEGRAPLLPQGSSLLRPDLMAPEIAHATVQELGQMPVDVVLQEIDHGLVRLPTYLELYQRWERQQWRTQDIDFSEDQVQWATIPAEQIPNWIKGFVLFGQGEFSVTDTLVPFLNAVPTAAQRIFLTTQLVDEARHSVFFERFFREVVGLQGEDAEDILAQIRQYIDPAPASILLEALPEVADRCRREPENRDHVVAGVTLYHILTEGTLALAGQRNMLDRYRRLDIFPGFRAGFMAAARDESRHVLFGVRFLRDMIQQDRHYADVVVQTIQKHLPVVRETLYLREGDREVLRQLGEDPDEITRYGMDSLRKKLKVMGLPQTLAA
jgi:ribonucleoside-diphosphate reductase beta chain